jgi:hypothetical protein
METHIAVSSDNDRLECTEKTDVDVRGLERKLERPAALETTGILVLNSFSDVDPTPW